VSLLFALFSPAWASDVLIPEATPASMEDFSVSYTVYSMVVSALENEGLSVDDGDEIREWAGDIADGCALLDDCPANLFSRSEARLALVLTIGQNSRGLNVEAKFFGADDSAPLKVLRQGVAGGGEQEFSKKLARTAAEMLPLLPERSLGKGRKSSSKATAKVEPEEAREEASPAATGTWSSRYGSSQVEELDEPPVKSSKSSKASKYDDELDEPPVKSTKSSKSSKASKYDDEFADLVDEPDEEVERAVKEPEPLPKTSKSSKVAASTKGKTSTKSKAAKPPPPPEPDPEIDFSDDEDFVYVEEKPKQKGPKIDLYEDDDLVAAEFELSRSDAAASKAEAAAAKIDAKRRSEDDQKKKLVAEAHERELKAAGEAAAKAAAEEKKLAEAEARRAEEERREEERREKAAQAEAAEAAKAKVAAAKEADKKAKAEAEAKAAAEAAAEAEAKAAAEADAAEAARVVSPLDLGDDEDEDLDLPAEKPESKAPAVSTAAEEEEEDLLAPAPRTEAKAEAKKEEKKEGKKEEAPASAKREKAEKAKKAEKTEKAETSKKSAESPATGAAARFAGDASAAQERARMGIPWADYARYRDSGQDQQAWLQAAKVHAGHGYVEASGGYALGDVDRGYGVRVAIDGDFNSTAVSSWTGSGASEGGAPVGRIAVGYVPSWFLDTSVAFGVQGGQKHLNTGWYCPDACESTESETPYAAVDAAQLEIEPRVRILPLATGLVKPYGLVGFDISFYDAFHIPDENSAVKYPDVAAGVALGATAGAGVMIDPTPNLSVLVEVPFSYILSDGTARSIDPGLPLVPSELDRNGWTLRFVAGVQVRL
jgi:hypothetical protein